MAKRGKNDNANATSANLGFQTRPGAAARQHYIRQIVILKEP